jgi:DNA-nicking Smr family endonuclease
MAAAMSRRRPLSDDEEALWKGFARSITPLRRPATAKPKPAAEIVTVPPAPILAPESQRAVPLRETRKQPKAPPPAAPAPLDRRLRQRVARGREPIEARLDLHGMTQTQAHAALLRFLRRAQADGAKMALVVTGKGSSRGSGDPAAERGVLRRQVPLWLSLPEFRSLIVGFDDAHVSHGGQGALYVRLRRPRAR